MRHSAQMSGWAVLAATVAAAALPALPGCGGGTSVPAPPGGIGTGTLTLRVTWPAQPSTAAIPADAAVIEANLLRVDTNMPVKPPKVCRRTDTECTVVFSDAPLALVRLIARAYRSDADRLSGRNKLAEGMVEVDLAQQPIAVVAVILQPTGSAAVDHITITPDPVPALAVGGDATLTATAYDATGQAIELDAGEWSWSKTDPNGHITYTSAGNQAVVHGESEGAATVTASVRGVSAGVEVGVGAAPPAGSYFPLAPGSRWQSASGVDTLGEQTTFNGHAAYPLVSTAEGGSAYTSYINWQDGWVSKYGTLPTPDDPYNRTLAFAPAMRSLPEHPQVGATWSQTGVQKVISGDPMPFTPSVTWALSGEVTWTGSLSVAAGAFPDCVAARVVSTVVTEVAPGLPGLAVTSTATTWYARGVGPVKGRTEFEGSPDVVTWELSSYRIGP